MTIRHSTAVDLECGCPPIHVTADVEGFECSKGHTHLRLTSRGEYVIELGERLHWRHVHGRC